MKKIIFLLFSLLFIFIGCSKKNNTKTEIILPNKTKVSLPQEIKKVACCSNPGVDMMIAFGLEDYIVAVHKSLKTNVWTQKFTNKDFLIMDSYNPEFENLMEMDIDLVFLTTEENCIPLREKGICAIPLRFYTYQEVIESAKLLGEIFGTDCKKKSNIWIKELESTIHLMQKKIEKIPENEKPVVYEVLGDKYRGLFRTNYGEAQGWITFAGGNIATKDFIGATSANQPTEEAILATNPNVVFISGIYYSKLNEDIRNDIKWAEIPAVKNNRIYNVPVSFLGWNECTTTYPLMIYYAFSKLYPSMVDYDMKALTGDFIKKYYNVELSENEIQYLLETKAPNGEALVK